MNRDGTVVSGGVVAQFEQALANLLAALAAAGGQPADLVSLTIYIVDLADYQAHGKELGVVWRRLAGAPDKDNHQHRCRGCQRPQGTHPQRAARRAGGSDCRPRRLPIHRRDYPLAQFGRSSDQRNSFFKQPLKGALGMLELAAVGTIGEVRRDCVAFGRAQLAVDIGAQILFYVLPMVHDVSAPAISSPVTITPNAACSLS